MRRTLIVLTFVMGFAAACGGSAATGAPKASGAHASGTQVTATQKATGATATTTAGPTATSAGAPKALDPCSLLTNAEAAAMLGRPVDPGTVPEPGSSSCLWVVTAISTDSVEISITSVADFNPTQKSINGLTITRVSGIGDDAYYLSLGAGYEVLDVRKGQTTFTTSVLLHGASNSQLMADEKSLATLILGRI